ncbi:hypothetical protein D3C71_2110950 [compost metagenome]
MPGFGTGGGGLTLPDNGGGLGLPGGLQLPGGSPLDQKPADQNGGAGAQPQTAPSNDLSQPPSFK